MLIKNLSKSFDGSVLFDGLSYELDSGVYCLMAPSGAGKTTFLRIIMGLEHPDGGSVSGVGRMSAVFQNDTLCGRMGAVANICIACGKSEYKAAAADLLRLGLTEEDLLKSVDEFSGGMRRRCEIVRAMLAQSDTVLMDEPFNGLTAPADGRRGIYPVQARRQAADNGHSFQGRRGAFGRENAAILIFRRLNAAQGWINLYTGTFIFIKTVV